MTIKKRTITNFINNDYKEYAIHTLTSRGIPNFYDSLTPVQRIILLNSPTNNSKTLSVVGDCIKDNYHSGNSSLEKAINRLARPYDCSENLLIGDGFFGNQVTQDAASARYTSVKINPIVNELINKYKFLNKKDSEDTYMPLGIDIPIGLLIPIIGIAVGYSTIILPRSLKDIQNYLNGKITKLTPSFKDFDGSIKKYDNLDNAWLLEGNIEIIENKKTINIYSIPPMMKYQSFIRKLEKILDSVEYTIHNNSKSSINIVIQFSNKMEKTMWDFIKQKVISAGKMIIRENIVFIKDKMVLEYDSVENYLEDFKNKNQSLLLESLIYKLKENSEELEYLEAKLEYLDWVVHITQEKSLSEKDIEDFLSKFNNKIYKRLDDIRLKLLNYNERDRVRIKISEYKELIKTQTVECKEQEKYVKTITTKLNTKDKKISTIYDEEFDQMDGIEIFKPSNIEINDTELSENVEL